MLHPICTKPQGASPRQEVLAGLVERVTFHNPDHGFCVLRAKARGHRDLVTVVGHAAARDELAAELARVYPPIAAQLADLLGRIDAIDRQIQYERARAADRR